MIFLTSSYHRGIIDRFHILDPIEWLMPRRRATYCRRLSFAVYSTFTFAFKLFWLPLERVAPRLIRNGCCLTIAEDRSLGVTSYRKKKINSTLPEMKGIRVTPNGRTTSYIVGFVSLKEDKDLLLDCLVAFCIFFKDLFISFEQI